MWHQVNHPFGCIFSYYCSPKTQQQHFCEILVILESPHLVPPPKERDVEVVLTWFSVYKLPLWLAPRPQPLWKKKIKRWLLSQGMILPEAAKNSRVMWVSSQICFFDVWGNFLPQVVMIYNPLKFNMVHLKPRWFPSPVHLQFQELETSGEPCETSGV